LTFMRRAVSRTDECLCMTALSISRTTSLLAEAGSVRTLLNDWYTKFSNSTESTPPSMI
jgi:hypothetical protein